MKKYIEKAIDKGLIFSSLQISRLEEHNKGIDIYKFYYGEDDNFAGWFDINNLPAELIKAVFKSLFGEELYYFSTSFEGGNKTTNGIKFFQHHLVKWITSDLTPEKYLDKYYKE